MSKHGIGGHPPGVGVSNNSKKKADDIVNDKVAPINKGKKDAPTLDPRIDCMGQFAIPQNMLHSKFDDIMRLMSDIVVIGADLKMTPEGNVFVYTGISEKYFKPVKRGIMVPQYDIAMRLDGLFEVNPARKPAPAPQIIQ